MYPVKQYDSLVEINIDNFSTSITEYKDKLDEKYYVVKKDEIYGIYHKYYGFTTRIDTI